MDGQWQRYVNLYRRSLLALSKQQLAEERDKRRFLSYKFSVSSLSSRNFSWPVSIYGDGSARVEALRREFLRLQDSLPAAFLHSAWRSCSHCLRWIRAVNLCSTPAQFALALSILVACIKPVVFRNIWRDAVGNPLPLYLFLPCSRRGFFAARLACYCHLPLCHADLWGCRLTLWRPVVPHGYSYKASYARPG